MKTIQCKCDNCGNDFEKPLNEYNRCLKLKKSKLYCSLKCSGNRTENKNRLKEIGKSTYFKGGENRLITDDEISLGGLKEFSRRVRRRKNFYEELNPNDLLKIWKNQNGKCAITKVDLLLPNNKKYKLTNNNYKASIDRIDSSKPYTIDNVQFLSVTMNCLKMDMDDMSVNQFIQIIKNI